jgi:hypothetical protein
MKKPQREKPDKPKEEIVLQPYMVTFEVYGVRLPELVNGAIESGGTLIRIEEL